MYNIKYKDGEIGMAGPKSKQTSIVGISTYTPPRLLFSCVMDKCTTTFLYQHVFYLFLLTDMKSEHFAGLPIAIAIDTNS